jgi:Putative beta-barrel porin 2
MLGWACAAPIHAAQVESGVGLSILHNSNIRRVETEPQSEWTEALIVGLSFRENTADLTANVLAQLERRHFVRNTFSDDSTGFVDGAAIWTILPRRLAWNIEDTFRQVLLDITAQDTPTNRAKSNSLNTGPDFTFPLSSTNSAVIGGRYGRFDIENSINDNKRYKAYARGLHALSPQTKISLNFEATRVFFEPGAQPYPEVLKRDWFGRFENRSATNSAVVDLGTSKVTQYGGQDLDRGRIARLALSEALSSQSTVSLGLSNEFSDTFSDLVAGVGASSAPREGGVVTAAGDLYHSRRNDLGYLNKGGQFEYALQVNRRQVDFATLDQDYHERGGTFLLAWLYSGAVQFAASALYNRRTFDSNLAREDKDRNFGAHLTYRLNRNVTITMEAGRAERNSTVPLASFVDRRVMLLMGYSSGFYEVQSRR